MNLNKVFLIGRLAADPESRTTPSGQTVVTVRLATNRVWNNRATGEKQEQTEFHTIIAWSGLADIVSKYLRKGQLALFEGRLQTRSWQGQDGVKRYKTEIVADGMQLGPKAMNAERDREGTQRAPVSYGMNAGDAYQSSDNPAPKTPSYAKASEGTSATASVKEEDIPVIDENAPVTSDPIISDNEIEEKEIDLKDIPF